MRHVKISNFFVRRLGFWENIARVGRILAFDSLDSSRI